MEKGAQFDLMFFLLHLMFVLFYRGLFCFI